ncbi:kinase-like protein [Elaphomyces granulatus]
MASPPPYSSRSRTSPDDIRSLAEAMLHSSLSENPSLTLSWLSGDPSTKKRSTSPTLSTSSRRVSSSMAQDDRPADAIHLPSRGPSSTLATTSRTRERLRLAELERDELRYAVEDERARTSEMRRFAEEERAIDLPSWSRSSTLATTSRTRERLRLAELERDELRRAVEGERAKASEMRRFAEEERAIAERLKREGELKRDMRMADTKSPQRSTAGLFKAVCSTDLLFLIDTTGSMRKHINAAKAQVKSIVDDITVAFLNETEVRIAVVGYKDHLDRPNIQFLDFTSSVDRVRSFINELTATGGRDPPEDVLGGIRQALNATWKQRTRCIIHIADAPPHGRTLQNKPDSSDSYPNPGSEPHGLTHEPLLRQMIGLNINYALLRINHSTDLMAFTFSQAYAAASADCVLHKSNIYHNRSGFQSRGNSKRRAKAGLLFEEAELGTTLSALRHLVVKVVTTSASRTAVRMSAARTNKEGTDKKLDSNLAAIEEDEDDVDDVPLETIPPQWDTPDWFNETLRVEGFSPDVVVHGASTLNDMLAHDNNIMMSFTELTIRKRSRPFAQGALRVAFFAHTAASTNRFVVKSFKRGGKRLAHLAEDLRCQALCKAFALEFNALSGEEHSIDFIVSTCLKGKSGMASGDACLSLEPFIEGTYVKYNNNWGYVNEENPGDRFNEAAQAFSHFTFERSRGCFLVNDLQGVGHLLTDPAIHALDPERFKLSETNLGQEGFKFFFATHVCNAICRKLGLKSNASMIILGNYKFRETWPSMDNTVCCSNKLCGMIVRLASAKKSDQFPGHHWCDACWPQLRSSMIKWICVAPGPRHEFDVSEFFYVSQGRRMPRKCPEHCDEDVTVPRTSVVGSNHWNRLKSATTMNGPESW